MDTLLTCIIIDDEPLAVRLLESFVIKTPDLKLLGSYTDSVEAINAVREQRPQLLFLDIQMPDLNGMELAHMLPEGTKVIFTTAFKEYAYESYEVSALDFLLKPIRYNKFITAVEKAREWFGRSQEHHAEEPAAIVNQDVAKPINTVFLKVDGEYRQVALDKILYVCGMKDYVMVPSGGARQDSLCLRHERLRDVLRGGRTQTAHHSPDDEERRGDAAAIAVSARTPFIYCCPRQDSQCRSQ